MISFFYITPMFIKFAERNLNTQEFTNNSKKILAYTLNNGEAKGQQKVINEDEFVALVGDLNK